MPGKIMTSRDDFEDSTVETLQELLFIIKETLDKEDEDIPEDLHAVLEELDNDTVELIIEHTDLIASHSQAIFNIQTLSLANDTMNAELEKVARVFVEMVNPPSHQEIVDKAFNLLESESRANAANNMTARESVAEAFKSAISYYNSELINKELH